jgi:hypothetical protein
MRASGRADSRVRRFAVLGAAGSLVGCLQVLGFDNIDEHGPCARDEDCPAIEVCEQRTCELACADDRQCAPGSVCEPTGGRGRCTPAPDASSVRADADVPLDAVPDTSIDNPDADAEAADVEAAHEAALDVPADANGCSPGCSPFSLCRSGACLDSRARGFPGTGSDMQIAGDGLLHAVQISLNVCGYLTGIGFDAKVAGGDAGGPAYRLAVYADDGGGHPAALLAQTGPNNVATDGANDAPVEVAPGTTPPVLGCSDANIYLWIAAVWNKNAIEFAADSSEADWVWVHADVNDVLANGFKSSFPGPGNAFVPPNKQPHVYVIVASDPRLQPAQPND